MQSNSGEKFHICFIWQWQLDNYTTISQWWKNNKVESWRGEKMPEVEIIVGGNRSLLCALLQNSHYFNFTSQKTCNTSYKYKYKYNLQVAKNRPLVLKEMAFHISLRIRIHTIQAFFSSIL